MSSTHTQRLATLIDQKHRCLLALRDVGLRQAELADQGEMTDLLKLLARKQQLIDLLIELEKALDPYRADDPDRRAWASRDDRQRCAAQAEACRELLNDVLAQEKQSESHLIRRRDETAQQLQGAHSAHQARRAYAAPSGGKPGMLDLSTGK